MRNRLPHPTDKNTYWDVEQGIYIRPEDAFSEEQRSTYYLNAYRQGQEAFLRGEDKSACPFTDGLYGTLGIRGWNTGWTDESGAAWLAADEEAAH